MPMFILIECSGNYTKASGSIQQYYRDEPALESAANITDFLGNNIHEMFRLNLKKKQPVKQVMMVQEMLK